MRHQSFSSIFSHSMSPMGCISVTAKKKCKTLCWSWRKNASNKAARSPAVCSRWHVPLEFFTLRENLSIYHQRTASIRCVAQFRQSVSQSVGAVGLCFCCKIWWERIIRVYFNTNAQRQKMIIGTKSKKIIKLCHTQALLNVCNDFGKADVCVLDSDKRKL